MKEVTIVIVEGRFPERVKMLSDYLRDNFPHCPIRIKSDLGTDKKMYDRFCAVGLGDLFNTSHCLVCQLDGYPINPPAWKDEWLEYDYMGAPWPVGWLELHKYPYQSRVGNGGFSLRSKRLCDALAKEEFEQMPDDVFVSGKMRPKMEEAGLRYCEPSEAILFSKEHNVPEYDSSVIPFGFHSSIINPQWKSF